MNFARDLQDNMSFALKLATILVCCVVASYLGIESFYYVAALAIGGRVIVRQPVESVWVGFLLLAVTSQLYPIRLDEVGASLSGAYQPYILVVIVVALSIFWGQHPRPVRGYDRGRSLIRNVGISTACFVGVMFLSLAYGYFRSRSGSSMLDVLRACSGWMTFLIFLFLGSRISLCSTHSRRALARLRLSALVYSGFFIIKFMYLSLSLGAEQTAAGYGYSQRDMAFFCGVVLVVLIAQALTSEGASDWRVIWPAGLCLVLAVILTGSRSVLLSILVVTLSFVLVWRSKVSLRFALVGLATVVVILIGASRDFSSQEGLSGYVSGRFLGVSAEDSSLMSRASEMVAVGEAVRENPLLGRGPLASYSFFDPIFGWKDTTFVDSGIGYLLMKSGLLGTILFIWFTMEWLKMTRHVRSSLPEPTLAPLTIFVFYLVFLPFGPSFFAFQYSWLIGLLSGQLILLGSAFRMVKSVRIVGAFGKSPA